LTDRPLSKLHPRDPENMLSREARQRIQRAYSESQQIRDQALAKEEIRFRAKKDFSGSLDDFLRSGQAFINLAKAQEKAARAVLRIEAKEYRELRLPEQRLYDILRECVQAAANSLELSDFQRAALETEFILLGPPQAAERPSSDAGQRESVSVKPSRNIKSTAGAARVEAYRKLHGLTFVELAEKAYIGEKTLRRVVKTGQAMPLIWAELAKAMGVARKELLQDVAAGPPNDR
jgi:hypothetical protein